ncbi:MAG: hypothetical protein Q4A76_11480, partial [Porphyromonadaceae bacterium]|nr:hypothetical protein [Porphyromonadaceae bacterium]
GVHPIIQDFVVGLHANFLVVFEVIFTICFIADIICTVVTLMKRKQVFKKLRMDIDELVDQFEKDRDEFNDHLEQWLSEKKDVIDLTPIQERMAMIEKIKKKHVMRAFPDRQLSNRLQHLEELGNKVKNQKEK